MSNAMTREQRDGRCAVWGPKKKLQELGQEMMRVGVVAGVREVARDTFVLEYDKAALASVERMHVSQFMATSRAKGA